MPRSQLLARLVLCAASASAAYACVYPRPAAELPAPPYIAVLSGQMPPPIDQVARHAWIVVQPANGPAHRYEYGSGRDADAFDDFAAGDVMLHGVVTGTVQEIDALDACLDAASHAYYERHPDYFPIPGPNSNTYVAFLDRRCSLYIELPATAIGRDYVGPVGVDLTEGRTGVQIGSIPLGLRIGLREGISIQVFGLPIGVHLVPPGIDVPVNPGRIGFATDAHVHRDPEPPSEEPFPEGPSRHGAASVELSLKGFAVVDPRRAAGLVGVGLASVSARVIYGDRVGFAAGLDLEMGVGGYGSAMVLSDLLPQRRMTIDSSPGLAGRAHLYVLGVGAMLTPTGYVGLFSGIGASGVTGGIPSGLELPIEQRLELDVGRWARIALFSRETFVALEPLRSAGLLGLGETTFGLRARFGSSWPFSRGAYGSGYYFGFERREVMATSMLGFSFGTELDAGYTAGHGSWY